MIAAEGAVSAEAGDSFEANVSDARLDFKTRTAEATRRKRLRFRGLMALGGFVCLGLGLGLDLGALLQDSRGDTIDALLTYGGPLIGLLYAVLFFILLGEPLEQSFAFVWNPADEVLERHAGESSRAILTPAEGNFWVFLVPAPWAHVGDRFSHEGQLKQALDKSFVAASGDEIFLYQVNLLKERDPPLPFGGELHDDPRVSFQMAVLLFSFLVRTMSDQCTFVVQTTMGSFEVEDEADLSAVKALIALPFVEGISNLFPDET